MCLRPRSLVVLLVFGFAWSALAVAALPAWAKDAKSSDKKSASKEDKKAAAVPIAFPKERPVGACYPRPLQDECLDISPPGFCWWPAGKRGQVRYRLEIRDAAGKLAYQSPVIDDPAHSPNQVLPAGAYRWTVAALDSSGQVCDTCPAQSFRIAEKALAQPWVPARELLARVPKEHPRLIFTKAQLPEIKASLSTTRKEAFEALKRQATKALKLKPPVEPDYDKLTDASERRMAYQDSFRDMRDYHTDGMVALSLMYVLTGEKKYGLVAKDILLGATEWDPEGVSSVMGKYGDEIGLGLVKSCAHAYDWIYDLLSDAERAKVRKMLVARADQMLRRLEKRDYLAFPEESHAGRLPGYMIEHAIAVAEEPRAEVWMDYAMRVFMTVFPHWAGKDGGWAEGVPYGLAYNTIYLLPLESLRGATGFDLWQRPFYRKVRYFFLYQIAPRAEITPFGDTEEGGVPGRSGGIRALLQFHALRFNDPVVRGWVDLLRDEKGRPVAPSPLPGLILADTLKPESPAVLPEDRAFFGVGWAALHSCLADPDRDLMLAFKSSPYGGVSHSHCDQNSFALVKGGRALAITGGPRYPTHGSPFHTKYAQQTMAHNAILVNGQGQVRGGTDHGGRLADFQSTAHLGYVCGDALNAYGGQLTRARRHAILVRPCLVAIVDDLAAPEAADFQWLLHTRQPLELNEADQQFVSLRGDASMKVHLLTPGGMGFSQTDQWPMDPKEGFPKLKKTDPPNEWHFTATSRAKAAERRIAAILFVSDKQDQVQGTVRQPTPETVEVEAQLAEGRATLHIDLSTARAGTTPILEVRYQPKTGPVESVSVK